MIQKKIFIYKARRDKSEVVLLTVLNYNKEKYSFTRIHDIKSIGLSEQMSNEIMQNIEKEKLYWEIWAESGNDYKEIKESLKNRGYKNIPIYENPKFFKLPEVTTKSKIKNNDRNLNLNKNNSKGTMLRNQARLT